MKATVYLVDSITKEMRQCIAEHDTLEQLDFVWTEGNMACDCNRAVYFGSTSECGNTRYIATHAILESGESYRLDVSP